MCDDQPAATSPAGAEPALSRRGFMHASAGVAAAAALLRRFPRLPLRSVARYPRCCWSAARPGMTNCSGYCCVRCRARSRWAGLASAAR